MSCKLYDIGRLTGSIVVSIEHGKNGAQGENIGERVRLHLEQRALEKDRQVRMDRYSLILESKKRKGAR